MRMIIKVLVPSIFILTLFATRTQTLSMRDQLYLDHKDDDNNAILEEGKSKLTRIYIID